MNRSTLEMIVPEKLAEILQPSARIAACNGRGVVVSWSLPWPTVPLIAFLRQSADAPRVYWESEKASVGFAGCGEAAVLMATGRDRFRAIRQEAARLFENAVLEAGDAPAAVGPRLFGGFAFQAEPVSQGIWSAFPAAYFILPRYQLTHFKGRMWLTVNRHLRPEDNPERAARRLREEIQELRSAIDPVAGDGAAPPEKLNHRGARLDIDDLMDPVAWHRLLTDVIHRIRRGELDKVVLAQACRVCSSQPIEPADVLVRLKRSYPDCYRFLIEPIPGHVFYGATPELLAEVRGPVVRTVAMAGSIRRGRSPEEDIALGWELMSSPKERHEHALVVEAVQKDLRPLVTELHVPRRPAVCRLSNIQHLQTLIQGELAEACGVLPVVEALHPTPAVGGCPREVALRIIGEAEPFPRGWYASPVGWMDPQGNGRFAVAIRSAVSVGSETWLFAGAGIVADSDPEREWQETRLKFRPILEALNNECNTE